MGSWAAFRPSAPRCGAVNCCTALPPAALAAPAPVACQQPPLCCRIFSFLCYPQFHEPILLIAFFGCSNGGAGAHVCVHVPAPRPAQPARLTCPCLCSALMPGRFSSSAAGARFFPPHCKDASNLDTGHGGASGGAGQVCAQRQGCGCFSCCCPHRPFRSILPGHACLTWLCRAPKNLGATAHAGAGNALGPAGHRGKQLQSQCQRKLLWHCTTNRGGSWGKVLGGVGAAGGTAHRAGWLAATGQGSWQLCWHGGLALFSRRCLGPCSARPPLPRRTPGQPASCPRLPAEAKVTA